MLACGKYGDVPTVVGEVRVEGRDDAEHVHQLVQGSRVVEVMCPAQRCEVPALLAARQHRFCVTLAIRATRCRQQQSPQLINKHELLCETGKAPIQNVRDDKESNAVGCRLQQRQNTHGVCFR